MVNSDLRWHNLIAEWRIAVALALPVMPKKEKRPALAARGVYGFLRDGEGIYSFGVSDIPEVVMSSAPASL